MKYSRTNPMFEIDIYKSLIDNSWNLFVSILRWSFAIQLSKPDFNFHYAPLSGNYSDADGNKLTTFQEEEAEEEWMKQWERSVEGCEFPNGEDELDAIMAEITEDEEDEFHPLEGLYYSHLFNQFMEVKKDGDLFLVLHEKVPWPEFQDKLVASAIQYHLNDSSWEKIISL